MPSPWWREANKAWYATINGRQELLAKAPSKSDRKGNGSATSPKEKVTVGISSTLIADYREWTWEARCQLRHLVERALADYRESWSTDISRQWSGQVSPLPLFDGLAGKGSELGRG